MKIKLAIFALVLLLSFTACEYAPQQTPSPVILHTPPSIFTPTPTVTPLITRVPSPTPIIPDTGWLNIRSGFEQREINLVSPQNNVMETMVVFRIDPQQYRFEIHHQRDMLSLESWQQQTNALAVLNGGYFQITNELYYPTGLTVSSGELFGASYGDFAAMFTSTNGQVDLRWLAEQPYSSEESIEHALQSFPILIKPGGVLGFPSEYEDYQTARRTAIGIDQDGRVVLIFTKGNFFTLHMLSAYLAESDLNLDIAVNLDGGPSTGFLLLEPYYKIPSGTGLPFVITIHQK